MAPVQCTPYTVPLGQMRANLARNGPQLYVGQAGTALVWAGPQQAMLVLGPPRAGKTSALVIPNVLACPGPLVVTSTKPDVLQATLASRSQLGRCWLFDPTGTVPAPPGVQVLRWSPVQAAANWEEALVTARVMTLAARPEGRHGESAHWTERAEALLAPLLHAAALAGAGPRQVLTWALRHDAHTAMAVLAEAGQGSGVAMDVLAGIIATEDRERSGIYSTAAGVLGAYRSGRALAQADQPNFSPTGFISSADTVYICGPARYQAITAPIAVAFLEQVRAATYGASARGELRLPVTLVLDEVANVAPLPDLPAMVSEGGGQGLLTMACLQDLSQARARWGAAAEGFFSLFGTKVLLGGLGDMRALGTVSRLAGEKDVPVRSVSSAAWWSRSPSSTTTWSTRRQPRLPVDEAHALPPLCALVVKGPQPPRLARLSPWWTSPIFAEAAHSPVRTWPAIGLAMGPTTGPAGPITGPAGPITGPAGPEPLWPSQKPPAVGSSEARWHPRPVPLPPSPVPGTEATAQTELPVRWRLGGAKT